jgi:hypothetical protein
MVRKSDTVSIAASVNTPTPKNHVIPLVMDLIPLGILAGVGSYCSTVKYDSSFEHTASDRSDCLAFLGLSGWVFMSLGTVPSHIYVKNKWYKVVGLSSAKAVVCFGFTILGWVADYQRNDSDTSPEGWDGGVEGFKHGTLPALISTFIIYGYEIIDHQLKVRKYNIELEQNARKTQTLVTPLIWKDRMGLTMQMSF